MKAATADELRSRLSLRPKDVVTLTGIGLTKVKDHIRTGRLKSKKDGSSRIVLMDDLNAFLANLGEA